jgi:hypothetical protein
MSKDTKEPIEGSQAGTAKGESHYGPLVESLKKLKIFATWGDFI